MPIPPQVTGYVVGKRLGRGSRHEVWRAWRRLDDTEVAIKVPRAESPAPRINEDRTARLPAPAHPNLMAIIDYVTAQDGRRGLVLPVVEGGSLARLVALRGHLLPGEIVTLLVPLLHAVHELALAGIVHGDISPANVLLTPDGRPVIADLDPHRWLGEPSDDAWATAGFVAPEVLEGHAPGPSADVYAIAALGWFALTGAPIQPLQDPTLVASLEGVPEPMLAWLRQVLVADPGQRPTAALAAQSLEALAPGMRVEVADDAWGPVTHRVRELAKAAAAQEAPPARRWTVSWLGRGRGAHSATRSPGARVSVDLRRVPVLGAVVLAAVLIVASLAVWRLAFAPEQAPAVITIGPAATQSAAAQGRGAATQSAPAAGTTAGTSAADPAAIETSPATTAAVDLRDPLAISQPAAVIQALFDRRATAWAKPGAADASDFDATGSWAHAQDVTRLRDAGRRGLRQQEIRFTVRDAGVESTSPGPTGHPQEAVIRATVDTSGYRWTAPSGAGTAAAKSGVPTSYVLAFTGDGWRFARVQAS